VVHGERSRDCSGALAGGQAPDRFLALMFIELRLSTEPGAPSPGGLPAVVSPLHDPLALILGQCAEERERNADPTFQLCAILRMIGLA
jgi:hypothetical protein